MTNPACSLLVRRSVSEVIGVLAKSIVPRGEWPDLIPTVVNAAADIPSVQVIPTSFLYLASLPKLTGQRAYDVLAFLVS